jgi:hypothetical protein
VIEEEDSVFRAIVFSAVLLAPTWCLSDTTLVYDEGNRTNALRIAGGKVRLDDPDAGGWMLFDSATRTLTAVEPQRREYVIMDETTLDSLQQTLDAALSQMEAQLAGLPPETREQMRQMMGIDLPKDTGSPEVKVQDIGRDGNAAGHDCRFSQVEIGGTVQSKVCLSSAAKLGVPAEDAEAVRAWQEFARSMAERASRFVDMDAGVFGDGDQVPLIYEHLSTGTKGTLTEINHETVDPQLLKVPAGYREQQLDMRM